MNRINEIQNQESSLRALLAQRKLYSQAKDVLHLRGGIALSIAIAFPLVGARYPGTAFWLALIAGGYFVTDYLFLNGIESSKKCLAAKIQEKFDTNVFSLPWNDIVAGSIPDNEDIQTFSEVAFHKETGGVKKELKAVQDWYPSAASKLPQGIAVTICQRANVLWDSNLRRCFANILTVLSTVLILGCLAACRGKSIEASFVLLAPFAPLIRLFFQQISAHRKAAERLDTLKEHLDKALQYFSTNSQSSVDTSSSRSVQDELFRHRSEVTTIPDIFYNILKKRYEKQMGFNADAVVQNYINSTNAP